MATTDPLDFLRAAHVRAAETARTAMEPAQFLYPAHPVEFLLAGQEVHTSETRAAEAHIRLHMPEAVLVRIEAERALLALHEAVPTPAEALVCKECGEGAQVRWPCRTLTGLARAWGWTDG
ncbi:DUF6221 family protein [Streptacidiphilus rugosus]|uniref:DUF6221 family protein n=1 Tax=Streptacidiphilus rugosus TaxID=405783 RepID=UPI0005670445|nr:DUF6221 family protein [Streptacidiphilus rugosus]